MSESDVVIQTAEVSWKRLQDIRAGEPLTIDAGDRLVVVVSDHQADEVVQAFEESLDDVEIVESGDVDPDAE